MSIVSGPVRSEAGLLTRPPAASDPIPVDRHPISRRALPALAVIVGMLFVPGAAHAGAAPDSSASPAEFAPAEPATSGRATARAAATGLEFADASRTWVRDVGFVTPATTMGSRTSRITRGQWVRALYLFEQWRATRYGTPRTLAGTATVTSLPDMAGTTIYAKAVRLGWITPINGRFAAASPVTSNDAALGMVSVLGLRTSAVLASRRLATEVPGLTGFPFLWGMSQSYVRSLGLRYNVLTGYDRNELGPTDAGERLARGVHAAPGGDAGVVATLLVACL